MVFPPSGEYLLNELSLPTLPILFQDQPPRLPPRLSRFIFRQLFPDGIGEVFLTSYRFRLKGMGIRAD